MSSCRSCDAPVFWVEFEKSGKTTPLDPQPTPDGNIVRVGQKGNRTIVRVLRKDEPVPEGTLRYVSHFATCPNSNRHRKPT